MGVSRASKLTSCILGILALSTVFGAQQPSASPCQNPTVLVGRDEDVQQAIDQAPEGAVLRLAPTAGDSYLVSLKITKSLTLCGTVVGGPTTLRGPGIRWDKTNGTPAVYIGSPLPIQVALHDLVITGTPVQVVSRLPLDNVGLFITGKAQVQLQNVRVTGHAGSGMIITDSAVVTISHSIVASNGTIENVLIGSVGRRGTGIVISESAEVTIEDSQIFENATEGLRIQAYPVGSLPLQVAVRRTLIYSNMRGILINVLHSQIATSPYPVRVSIEDSNISMNSDDGVDITAYSDTQLVQLEVTIARTRVAANGQNGIAVVAEQLSQVTIDIQAVAVEGNGASPLACWDLQTSATTCNGITVSGVEATRVTIADSMIRWNSGWGISMASEKCNPSYPVNPFLGQVLLDANNVIEGNNVAGRQQGEVCLP